MEKAVIVGVFSKKDDFRLKEVEELARNSEYLIVDEVIQIRKSPHTSYLIGPGKLQELKDRLKRYDIKTVIFANDLKPGQYLKLQKTLGLEVKILDRVLLILSVFDKRASTSEAKLQIELARLKYTLPWARELIRLRGFGSEKMGFGSLGGYPYKAYLSFARKRIKVIEEKLESIKRKQEKMVFQRKETNLPIVALTGYTQSGKTTLFNLLTKEGKVTGLGPFTTLETCARRVNAHGKSFIVVDSLGFIDEMPQLILDAFHATLVELRLADVVVLLIDVSDVPSTIERKLKNSLSIISEITGGDKPLIIATNKMDLVGDSRLENSIRLVKSVAPNCDVVPISAKKNINVDFLIRKIIERLNLIKTRLISD
ncbi:MAG: GTPase HflX [Candidatus Nezhaarchaeota archaeon]|nr:GTPase HflX [Candidatus Nezhaarchaeota archaeon]